jgi:serine/threonine-protein kinase RsbW
MESILLRIPATIGHVGLVRAAASAVAARMDFTYDRLTDLHIALDEVCSRVLATSQPPPTRLEVVFEIDRDFLRVSTCGDTPAKTEVEFLNRWSEMILHSVTDRLELTDRSGAVMATFEIGKSPAP